jgi:ATP-dependent RNA helicase DDX18/HAS1
MCPYSVHPIRIALMGQGRGDGGQAVAKSFGFNCPPKVQLALESRTKHKRKAEHKMQSSAGGGDYQRKNGGGGGRAFSAENPYGKRHKSDTRQFTR